MINQRLTYSTPEEYLRDMQLSSAQIIVFVEGTNFDRYFYGAICKLVFTEKYEIRLAEEIPLSNNPGEIKSAGGKKSLTSWFKYLEQKSALLTNFKGKKQIVVFLCECNYSNLPNQNQPLYNRLKDDIYFKYEQIVKQSSPLTEEQFQEGFESISNQVDELYAAGKHDMVFKGKWYAGFLEAKIEEVIGEKLTGKSGHKSYFQTIISTLDFNGEWAEHFKRPLLKLIETKN